MTGKGRRELQHLTFSHSQCKMEWMEDEDRKCEKVREMKKRGKKSGGRRGREFLNDYRKLRSIAQVEFLSSLLYYLYILS